MHLQNQPKKNRENEKLSDRSILSYISGLRVILYFFMERGYVKQFSIELPKAEKKVRDTYTPSELELLLKKPDLKTCSFSEYRNWVLINYFLSTANRLSTALNLKIQDLNFDEDEIILRAVKNRRQYILPMDKWLKKILIEYLSYRKGAPEDYVFCKASDSSKPLSRNGMQQAISSYNLSRGVSRTGGHIFRNYYAKNYLLTRRF